MADVSFGILGTEAHAGPSCENEVAIYRELGVQEYGQLLNLEIDGKLHDLAHHGRVGGRSWTSSAAAIAVEVCMDCGHQGIPFPDYIWRAHSHIIDDSGLKVPGTRAITIPSWQLKTAFGNRVASNKPRSDIGGFIINGGVLDDSRSRYKAQRMVEGNRSMIRTENELLQEVLTELAGPIDPKTEFALQCWLITA